MKSKKEVMCMKERKEVNLNQGLSIAEKVKYLLDEYAKHPKKKDAIIAELRVFFDSEHEDVWSKVISLNEFRPGFKRIVGLRRLKILKPLLLEIDEEHYKDVIFE